MRAAIAMALLVLALGAAGARAQDTAQQEMAHRRAVLAQLPADAAKRLFGLAATPAPGPARVIGGYARGCIAGAVALPADGANWQVMRPGRNRAWGHPRLVAVLERLAAALPAINGWPGLLVGDIGQPRGGPMLTGHASHQIGLDADLWLTPMPPQRWTPAEREEVAAVSLVAADGDIDRTHWRPQHGQFLAALAHMPEVERMFVNPAIKRALCREAGGERSWLARVRPWWGHKTHVHIRLSCPGTDPLCRDQAPPPSGDGCGRELDWWFTAAARPPKAVRPEVPLRLSDLPAECAALVTPR